MVRSSSVILSPKISVTSPPASGASRRTIALLERRPDPGATIDTGREGQPPMMGMPHTAAADSWEKTGLPVAAAAAAKTRSMCCFSCERSRHVARSTYAPRRTRVSSPERNPRRRTCSESPLRRNAADVWMGRSGRSATLDDPVVCACRDGIRMDLCSRGPVEGRSRASSRRACLFRGARSA